MKANSIDISFQEGLATIRITDDQGITVNKFASHQEVLDALNQQVVMTPLLPPDTVIYARSAGKDMVVLTTPPEVRELLWQGYHDVGVKAGTKVQVPFPRCIFFITLRHADAKATTQNIFMDMRVFVMRGAPISMEDKLYGFPFGNVYQGRDGSICWGGNRPSCTNLRMAHGVAQLFLNSGFNGDLSNGSDMDTLRTLIKSKATTYPLEKLRQETTVQKVFNSLIR